MNKTLSQITAKIEARSTKTREAYLRKIHDKSFGRVDGTKLGCPNIAHTFAIFPDDIKEKIRDNMPRNYAIISAYNDMLSAHQPFVKYPDLIKEGVQKAGALCQFAAGVPAMCDGITQGYPGMELSLFSRDVIALSVAVGLSHNVFDGAFYLGVCDKIVPGLLIGSASFGHLPSLFVPSGPMTSGISNDEKSKARQLYAEGKISRKDLCKSEMQSYHSSGTCTFYGTANSNQMMVELMGLHLPNTAFINPGTDLREAIVKYSGEFLASNNVAPIGEIISAKNIINAMIGLMATGGSTNHTIHLIAIARAFGIIIDWDDFDGISSITPLLARIYPNGKADVNHFEAAGGLAFVVKELLENGLLHDDVLTVAGRGMGHYTKEPFLENDTTKSQKLPKWKDGVKESADLNILSPFEKPFLPEGGIKIMKGNIARAVIKVSAIAKEHQIIKARALIFDSQAQFIKAFEDKKLERDFIGIVRFQGPRANGMPELHKLIPLLSSLQDKGFKVALITDGRMSGASGKVPIAIHASPEALLGGNIIKIKEGDLIEFDATKGVLQNLESDFEAREIKIPDLSATHQNIGFGRELFSGFRTLATSVEEGAMSFGITN